MGAGAADDAQWVNGTAVTAGKGILGGTTGHRQHRRQLYCKQDSMVISTVRRIHDPSPDVSRAPSYSKVESRGGEEWPTRRFEGQICQPLLCLNLWASPEKRRAPPSRRNGQWRKPPSRHNGAMTLGPLGLRLS